MQNILKTISHSWGHGGLSVSIIYRWFKSLKNSDVLVFSKLKGIPSTGVAGIC